MTSQSIEFSVLVPFFNESGNVAPLISEIGDAMAGRSWELIAVDDASTDGTANELLTAAGDYPELRVLSHVRNAGQSAALCTAAGAATGTWLITLDGDGQNDPGDIPRLIDVVMSDPTLALVCGHRTTRRDSAFRRFSSRVANNVRAKLLGDATPDTGCSLKIMQRATFSRLPQFNHMHRFLPALVMRDGGGIRSVPVSHRPRLCGASKYGLWNRLWVGIVDLAGVIWLQRRTLQNHPREEIKNER